MKQVVYERRLLDIQNLNLYSIDGPKDDENNELDISFSYKKILGSLADFMDEKTLLQTVGEEIGKVSGINIIIDRSPKYHPEVAGEGIEYTWAMSKIYMRSTNKQEKAIESVSSAAYHIMHSQDKNSHGILTRLSKYDIEKMRKCYRSNQGMLEDDTGYCVVEAVSQLSGSS
eukprot:scaffold221418_cov54-Attheya_sp.AAC.1